jgi:hypothetical protein
MHSYLESISGLQGHAFDPTSPSPQQGSFSPATLETTQELNLPDSSFFSAVMLIKWSNVMGPEVEKVWASDDQAVQTKKATYTGIAKQVLNGEIGRTILEIEPKFLVLGDEGRCLNLGDLQTIGFCFSDRRHARRHMHIVFIRRVQ